MDKVSPDQRFEIICHTRDDDSYFYSDTRYNWFVASTETGDELMSFSGRWCMGRDGSTESGIQSVAFSDDGAWVITTDADGKTARKPLPTAIEIIDDGRAIRLTFAAGTTETRERRAVTMTTKYGQPIARPLVDDPSGR